jgi:type IV pilus assembly protein PilB
VPFKIENKKLSLATTDPTSPKTDSAVKNLEARGYHVSLFVVSLGGLEKAWKRYSEFSRSEEVEAGVIAISSKNLTEFLNRIKKTYDIATLISEQETAEGARQQISNVLEIIIAGAIATNASDIHIEPEKDEVRLRLRLDGVLEDITTVDSIMYHKIISRIKLVSGLKLNIVKEAQDGRFSIRLEDTEIEIRTSVIPGAYGESVVMRILNPKGISVGIEGIGINPKLFKVIEETISKPQGLILNTGPTGSGKTTSLYSFLKRINQPEYKIITIEDPIEYHLEGIVQTQTKEGYSFAEGLRSALRQDPDIIMVGEIRDGETAKTAIQAALTGHLVFSTLHTNNAAGTIPRLIDLGVDPKIIGSALTLALAQRLVRILCPDCKKERPLSSQERELVISIMEDMPKDERALLSADLEQVKVFEAVGCDKCNKTGYRGRTGVYEGIMMTRAVEEATINSPGEHDIRASAKDQGLMTLREHTLTKILAGITSFAEASRVVDLNQI